MIQHVFVLMLENRSFDHMLGFSGIEGADAVSGARTAVEGLDGSQSNAAGGQKFVAQTPAPFQMGFDPGHGFTDVVEQLGGSGAAYVAGQPYPARVNSGFAANAAASLAASGTSGVSPGEVLASFSPEQLPVINALAREFVVCDHWFSSMPGPTWPNRLFVHAATSGGGT